MGKEAPKPVPEGEAGQAVSPALGRVPDSVTDPRFPKVVGRTKDLSSPWIVDLDSDPTLRAREELAIVTGRVELLK